MKYLKFFIIFILFFNLITIHFYISGYIVYAQDDNGKYDQIISDSNRAIEKNPRDFEAYYNRGNAYDDKGEYDLAIADFNKAIKIDPKDAKAYYNRGIVYRRKGNLDRAIADYNKALKINPELAEAYVNRGFRQCYF